MPPVPELLHSLGCVALPCLPQDDEANGAPDQISARVIVSSCDLLRINTCLGQCETDIEIEMDDVRISTTWNARWTVRAL